MFHHFSQQKPKAHKGVNGFGGHRIHLVVFQRRGKHHVPRWMKAAEVLGKGNERTCFCFGVSFCHVRYPFYSHRLLICNIERINNNNNDNNNNNNSLIKFMYSKRLDNTHSAHNRKSNLSSFAFMQNPRLSYKALLFASLAASLHPSVHPSHRKFSAKLKSARGYIIGCP